MSYDVFVSHSTSDASVARETCDALEASGLQCWIAPRNIRSGQTWPTAIVEGIGASRVILVLISRQANDSPEVLREVELASRGRKHLLGLRLEPVEPAGGLSFFLSATQWLDAFPPPLAPRLASLVEETAQLLGVERHVEPLKPEPEQEFVEVDLDDFSRKDRGPKGFIGQVFKSGQ